MAIESFGSLYKAEVSAESNGLVQEVYTYGTVAPLYYNQVPCTIRPQWQEQAPGHLSNGEINRALNDQVPKEASPTCPGTPPLQPNTTLPDRNR